MIDLHACDVFLVDEFTRNPGKPLPVDAPDSAPQASRRTVLVVDDQKLIADTVREVLQHAGFNAHAAYDPWDAIDLAQRIHPDLLLSDILMPHMNGVDLAIAIRAMHPNARIVLFSGQAGISEILEDAERRGHTFEVLPKPIHPARLIEHLRDE